MSYEQLGGSRTVKRITSAAILIGIGLLSYYGLRQSPQQASMPSYVVVRTAVVKAQPIPRVVSATGSIYAKFDAELGSELGGLIDQIHFIEGKRVAAGERLITLKSDALQASLTKVQAETKQSELDYERMRQTARTGASTQQALDKAAAALAVKRAERAMVEAQLAQKVVTAPFAGVVGQRRLSPGDYVSPGDTLVRLINPEMLKVAFAVPERFYHQLKLDQTVTVRSDSHDQKAVSGTVDFIAPHVNEQTRNILLEASLSKHHQHLLAGMSVRVTLSLGELPQALVVPESSISVALTGASLYTCKQSEEPEIWRVTRKMVTLGVRRDGFVQITSGLSEGEYVVTEGQQKLRDGQQVRLQHAMKMEKQHANG